MLQEIVFLLFFFLLVRSTLRQSRPNKAGLKCPSGMTPSVRMYVHPQKVSSISMKFGM